MGVAPPIARDRILLTGLWVVTFLSKGALFYENHLGINRSTYCNETWNITLPYVTIFKNPSTRLEFPPKIRLKSQNPTVGKFFKKFPLKSV